MNFNLTLWEGTLKPSDLEAMNSVIQSFDILEFKEYEVVLADVLGLSDVNDLERGLRFQEGLLTHVLDVLEMMGVYLYEDKEEVNIHNAALILSKMIALENKDNHDLIAYAITNTEWDAETILIKIFNDMEYLGLLYFDLIETVDSTLLTQLRKIAGNNEEVITDHVKAMAIKKEFLSVTGEFKGIVFNRASMVNTLPMSDVGVLEALAEEPIPPKDLALELLSLAILVGVPPEGRLDYMDKAVEVITEGVNMHRVNLEINELVRQTV